MLRWTGFNCPCDFPSPFTSNLHLSTRIRADAEAEIHVRLSSLLRRAATRHFMGGDATLKTFTLRIAAIAFLVVALAPAAGAQEKIEQPAAKPEAAKNEPFKAEEQQSKGAVTIAGRVINYDAYAGTLVVHPKKPDDDSDDDADPPSASGGSQPPEATMFYVAYFKTGEQDTSRPVTFLYNGGPGSSTVWL